ncbi:hypothetical protein DFH07DRAFT_951339 [Mycena maculata]|uniref:Uncharacterized protein n=1 Tax=Mycena maculata TaxID=230809 RepID=A0AAD7NWC0_9AGAR|nr:hypothetical protein DFH07DRAFT_951339 [Mycena maculata]
MDCQFVFGPNRSYFCSAGPAFAWSGNTLPAGLTRVLQERQHPQALDTPYDVALPMEQGTFALCWKTRGGEDWYEVSTDGFLGPNYARLARFIKSVATTGGHTTRTSFGPEEDIHNCMKIRRPTSVALGVQGSYIVLYNDGTVTFDLRGHYPLVEEMIRNTQEASRKRGVTYVALNPFIPGEFYAVYGDGSASWNFPAAWTADVTVVSREIKPVPLVNPVAVAYPGGAAAGGTAVVTVAQTVAVAPGGTAAAPEVTSPTSSGGTASGIAPSVGHPVGPQGASQGPGGTVPSIMSSVGHAVSPQVTGGTVSNITSSLGHAVTPQVTGGTLSNITQSMGHPIQAVAAEVVPALPPAYTMQAQVSPATSTSAPQQRPPPAAATPHAAHHKMTWQEGLSMGLQAAEGISKIIHIIEE